MERIIRGLFGERGHIHKGRTKDFFSSDNISKVIRLMTLYSINENVPLQGQIISTPLFLERLSYHLPEGKISLFGEINQLHNYFLNSDLNDFISTTELFIQTIKEICEENLNNNYGHLNGFILEFNSLLALKTIPFRVEVIKNKIFVDRINSPKEEENKKKIYEIISSSDFLDANNHFTNSLINFAKKDYPESMEEAYLALEKYLKIKVGNSILDAPKAYAQFRKLFNVERGIFKNHSDKIKNKIDFIYTIRSEIKSHSDKETFDRKDFLEETARFQLNEVMALIILLDDFKKK
ncbi:MAG: hypothetical protein IIA87_04780 [Nanoarchaeota archaeon]|nr:hypothetical protein [Nanoarchaeota archaeon]